MKKGGDANEGDGSIFSGGFAPSAATVALPAREAC